MVAPHVRSQPRETLAHESRVLASTSGRPSHHTWSHQERRAPAQGRHAHRRTVNERAQTRPTARCKCPPV
eukprot:1907072-Prymnesium_polylepis.2